MLGDNLTAKQLEILQAIRAGSMKSELEGLAEENKKSEDVGAAFFDADGDKLDIDGYDVFFEKLIKQCDK